MYARAEDRRLPAPVDRRGGDDRRQRAGAARQRLPDLHLPLARPRARARHAARERDGRAVRHASTAAAAGAAARCTCSTSRAASWAATGSSAATCRSRPGIGAGQRLQGHRRGHALHVRRRRLQPGHVRRDAEPRRAVAAAGRLHGHQQPVRHGHRRSSRHSAVTDLQRKGESLGVPGHALRRHGRARHPRASSAEADRAACARSAGRCSSRPSPTASAGTRWPTPSSTAPRRRSRTGASATRSRRSGELLVDAGHARRGRARSRSTPRRSRASTRPSSSPRPPRSRPPESLYDDVYVLGGALARLVLGRRPTDAERARPAPRDGRRGRRANDEIPQQLTSALAAGEDASEQASG